MGRGPRWALERLADWLWSVDSAAARPGWRVALVRALRVAWVVLRDLTDGQLTLRAMSLVYTTLLSLVPLLALSFSVLKAFGVHNQIEPLVLNLLAPLGERGVEVGDRIIGFVANLKVGVLGSIGLALLLYTAISLIQKIEDSFNYIWHVTRLRPLSQRFSEYLSVILVGPVLVVAALGITASALNTALMQQLIRIEPFGTALWVIGKLLPYLLVIGAFAFIYVFIPNTRVRVVPAMIGAVVAGVIWETAGWAFASFVVTSTRYTAIYSGFAILIMFMIWVYVSWLILLLGAGIAFYVQHPEYVTPRRRHPNLSPKMYERIGLSVMLLAARGYHDGERAWTSDRLARRLGVALETVDAVLDVLLRAGMLTQTAGDPPAYVPARAPETIPLKDLLDTVRTAGENAGGDTWTVAVESAADDLLAGIDRAVAASLEGRSLRDLVAGGGARAVHAGDATEPRP